jgi:hypothetical protein
METLGKRSRNSKYSKKHWLQEDLNENSKQFRANSVAPLLIRACKEAGFYVRIKGWEKEYSALKFACHRSRPFKSVS